MSGGCMVGGGDVAVLAPLLVALYFGIAFAVAAWINGRRRS